MNWANFGRGSIFGPLSPLQQTFYENEPNIAYQGLTDWFGRQGGFNENTTFGQYLASQRGAEHNRFLTQQVANPGAGLTFTNYLEQRAPQLQQQFQSMPGFQRNNTPGMFRVRRELW